MAMRRPGLVGASDAPALRIPHEREGVAMTATNFTRRDLLKFGGIAALGAAGAASLAGCGHR